MVNAEIILTPGFANRGGMLPKVNNLQSLIEADVWGALNYLFWGAFN